MSELKLSENELLEFLELWWNKYHQNSLPKGDYDCRVKQNQNKENKCYQAYRQIVVLIKKPQVTEEWIEEKAKELIDKYLYRKEHLKLNKAKDFIRSLVEGMPRQKTRLDEKFVIPYAGDIFAYFDEGEPCCYEIEKILIKMLKDAGMEVVEK